jgi:hypothetical protein
MCFIYCGWQYGAVANVASPQFQICISGADGDDRYTFECAADDLHASMKARIADLAASMRR